MKKNLFIFFIVALISSTANSQVLISLLLGDKLNSDNIEFGLDGGFNYSTLHGIKSGSYASDLFLGFYFDFTQRNPDWILHTGVLVKSSVGADDVPYNYIENDEISAILEGTKYRKELNYFYIPFTVKYRFLTLFNVEAGLQIGLMHEATDIYKYKPPEGGKLTYELSAKHQIKKLDAGYLIGIGSKLSKERKSMQCGIKYYRGFVDIDALNITSGTYNSSIYLYCCIPIGAKKAENVAQKNSPK